MNYKLELVKDNKTVFSTEQELLLNIMNDVSDYVDRNGKNNMRGVEVKWLDAPHLEHVLDNYSEWQELYWRT